jgi:hypothetical protein
MKEQARRHDGIKVEPQLAEQSKKHAEQLAELKQTTMEAHNMLTHKSMVILPMQDNKVAAHFSAMQKACETLFDGQHENWPTFEIYQMNEADELTIGWNIELLSFEIMGQTGKNLQLSGKILQCSR